MRERGRIGVLVTHPIQYYAPLFRRLAAEPGVDLTVYYAYQPSPREQGKGFGVAFTWDVDLLSGYDSRFLANVSAAPGTSGFTGCDTPEIADVIARERFDAFLVAGWQTKSYWQAMRACWATHTPVMVRGDSQLGDGRPSLRAWARMVTHRMFIPRFAACLAVGTRSEEYFRFYGARRIVRSPHFVDNEHFASGAATADVGAIRQQWGVRENSMIAAFVGKLQPIKRPLDLLEAVAASGRSDIHVVYVGDGELREACRATAERLAVPVTMAGFHNQKALPGAYAAMDVLVLPSESETWGLVVNEAMACGTPALVSTAAGCAPDLIGEGETGYSFAAGDVVSLGRQLGLLAASSDLRRNLGAAARGHIAGFTATAAAAGVLEGAGIAARERAA